MSCIQSLEGYSPYQELKKQVISINKTTILKVSEIALAIMISIAAFSLTPSFAAGVITSIIVPIALVDIMDTNTCPQKPLLVDRLVKLLFPPTDDKIPEIISTAKKKKAKKHPPPKNPLTTNKHSDNPGLKGPPSTESCSITTPAKEAIPAPFANFRYLLTEKPNNPEHGQLVTVKS